mmetsp:Transcript_33081/g.60008  ORF Transcript_33081/g.60008 Transcript_33081/m.60008 type:complete len:588 (-) Transcript_33081:79-1842(-)|eukprot:CAMPEP_0197620972 /NCGR_PEP_ID=MMETSP1338-20131121/1645_1 /TAXON_ID=43686 ORGANISM="Pelagodinium beii, Strain RCC1491" /NCGR_SAMPLE_ID=MMETSP1338 /ASSEMBLY_ACC=CAM_ASM_000754 /LENGTH=587 /DNA_ID=CAMNT_0043190289 /DNA_START=38 /DNA_END=1801 /DNA_ORIENTATION=-
MTVQAKLIILREDGSEETTLTGLLKPDSLGRRYILIMNNKLVRRNGKNVFLDQMSEAPEVSEDGSLLLKFEGGCKFRIEMTNAMDMEGFVGDLRKRYTDELMKKDEKSTTVKAMKDDSLAKVKVVQAVLADAPPRQMKRTPSFDDFGSTSKNRLPDVGKKTEDREAKRRAIDSKVQTSPEKNMRYGPGGSSSIKYREPAARTTVLQRRPSNPPQDSSRYGGYRSSYSFGLQNLGNTCYLNAVMQAMRSLREFVSDLQVMPKRLSACQEGELFKRTVEIMQQMGETGAQIPLSPAKLREQIGLAAPMFRGSGQQDAHEFFLEYVNQLHDELLMARKTLASDHVQDEVDLATQFFDSEVQKQLICMQCKHTRSVSEHFRDFSLDFVNEDSGNPNDMSVAGMLSSYFKTEVVEAKCEQCNCVYAHMEKSLAALPRVLVLHLKRFVPNIEKQCYEKQHQSVNIPSRLDLATALGITAPLGLSPARLPARPLAASPPVTLDSPDGASAAIMNQSPEAAAVTAESSMYQLRAIVSHEGTTPRSGHYVCYAQGESGIWRLYNDSRVTELPKGEEPQKQLGGKSYIVFYVLDGSR